MSIQIVREYFKQYGLEDKIMEFEVSSATVELAAQAVGVEGARICKTLSFSKPEGVPLNPSEIIILSLTKMAPT